MLIYMTSLWSIALTSFFIGLSGAMMPGPLLAVTVKESPVRGAATGPLLIAGHGFLEICLVILLSIGLGDLLQHDGARALVAVGGGAVLVWMGWRSICLAGSMSLPGVGASTGAQARQGQAGLLATGAILTVSNPYWLLWWATVGVTYASLSARLGGLGTAAFVGGHVLSDLAWYSSIAAVFSAGRGIMKGSAYRWAVIACGSVLLAFGLYFGCYGVHMLFATHV